MICNKLPKQFLLKIVHEHAKHSHRSYRDYKRKPDTFEFELGSDKRHNSHEADNEHSDNKEKLHQYVRTPCSEKDEVYKCDIGQDKVYNDGDIKSQRTLSCYDIGAHHKMKGENLFQLRNSKTLVSSLVKGQKRLIDVSLINTKTVNVKSNSARIESAKDKMLTGLNGLDSNSDITTHDKNVIKI